MLNLIATSIIPQFPSKDDCWASSRHPNGTLIADPKFFPSGTLKPLADYVHSKGMLFGTPPPY